MKVKILDMKLSMCAVALNQTYPFIVPNFRRLRRHRSNVPYKISVSRTNARARRLMCVPNWICALVRRSHVFKHCDINLYFPRKSMGSSHMAVVKFRHWVLLLDASWKSKSSFHSHSGRSRVSIVISNNVFNACQRSLLLINNMLLLLLSSIASVVSHTMNDLTVDYTWGRNRLFDKNCCEAFFMVCQADPTANVVSVANKPKSKWRPQALDTIELEKLGSRKLKISAKQTMTIAEKLYTQGFISYPRTETNMFSNDIQLR